MPRDRRHRAENLARELRPFFYKRLQEIRPRLSVFSEGEFRVLKLTFQDNCCAVIEWMRQRSRRMDPLEAEFIQRKRRKKRRARTERIHGRTEIVPESRHG